MAFNGKFILNLIYFASNQGVNASDLISLTGKTEVQLCDDHCRLENEVYNTVIEKAAQLTNDTYFGMHAGESLNLMAAGLIAQITQTSATIKQALEYCCEFANLGCSAMPMTLQLEVDKYKIVFVPDPIWWQQSPLAVRHTAEGNLAFAIREIQSLTLQKHAVLAIHLPWEAEKNQQEYNRVFQCPVHFGKKEIAIFLETDHVESKVISADYQLLRILVTHAKDKSDKLVQSKGFTSLVRQSLIQLVKPQFPTIEQVAGHLNISARTLQRRLQEEGFTFKALIDEFRKDFAINYLKNQELSLSQVAYLLGYADGSAFTRSFKRWMRVNPLEYRKCL